MPRLDVVPGARTPRLLAIVQAGGKGSRMDVLTRERAKPALPFAGSYQLIDNGVHYFSRVHVDDGAAGTAVSRACARGPPGAATRRPGAP